LFNWLLARGADGRFVVRVEDTDRERSRTEFLASQLEDLAWLGIDWDAGPGREDDRGPYLQSERTGIYAGLYGRLQAQGCIYRCYCTPTELEVSRRAQLAAGRPPRYAGTCRDLDAARQRAREAQGLAPTWRFRVPDGREIQFVDRVRGPQRFAASDIGDFIIRRADGSAAFFFSNAVDDALMGIDVVLRGEDHLTNTPRQLLLLDALGLPAPEYGHLPLLLGGDGAPLSKRTGANSLRDLREQGYLPAAILNYLLRLGHSGGGDVWLDPAMMAQGFRLERLGTAPAHFDAAQLRHWQRETVRSLDAAALRGWLAAAFGMDAAAPELIRLADIVRHNVLLPADAWPWLDVIAGDAPEPLSEDAARLDEAGPEFFRAALEAFDATGGDLGALTAHIRARTGRKGAALFMPLRIALTGRHDGPELAPLLRAIPPARVRARLAARAG
jgi:glutamyl-tRNA synthetase